jgi:hypothetical protein
MFAGGGKTVPCNLRIMQWQVCRKKQNKLEFLMPWWDLQLGVSVNQFLSIFASKNSDFRYAFWCPAFGRWLLWELNFTVPLLLAVQKQSIRVLVYSWRQRGTELAAGGGGARVPSALF